MSEEKKNLFRQFLSIASLPTDSNEERLRKENLMLMTSHFTLIAVFMTILFYSRGLWLISLLTLGHIVLTILGLVFLLRTKKFVYFRNLQLLLVLMIPVLGHVFMGGFVSSSNIILWAIVSPMAALFFITLRQSVYWFFVFVICVVVAFFIDDHLARQFNWEISDEFINAQFLINVLGVTGLVFLVQFYFARNERTLKEEVEVKNEQLGIQSAQLRELDKMKSNFFANISHEFRTPLTLIQGIVNRENIPTKEECEIVKRNSDRLLQLINQLLDLSKLESGEMQLSKKTIDLNYEARRVAQLFGSAADLKNIQFEINGHSFLEPSEQEILAHLDPEQMQKVLTNLISNAIKFCPIDGYISMKVMEKNDWVHLILSNTGENIPKEKLTQIFNRFYQVESDSTRSYEGTGIGLSLVNEIVQLHSGHITASSENELISFEIQLPKGEVGDLEKERIPLVASAGLLQEQKSIQPEVSIEKGQLKILVVEDYPDLRQFIANILRGSYTVIEASNGQEGIDKALEEIPDLIVSDVMMPKKDGIQLCSELKQHAATDHIPIVLLTAKAEQKDKLEGLEYGADDYLTKPFDEKELILRVRNLLQIRKKLQEKIKNDIWLKPSEIKVSSTQERFLSELKTFLEDNLSDDQLTAESLAKSMLLSRSQLHRKLKALTNQSTTEFIRNYRLERGASLLKQNFGTISEVAYQVGFNSQTYFSSTFQKYFGCSPTEYINS